jgi:hypothetical protein
VQASKIIHIPALPRAVRWWLAVPPSFHSWADAGGAADTLCQNSDVAIFISKASKTFEKQKLNFVYK